MKRKKTNRKVSAELRNDWQRLRDEMHESGKTNRRIAQEIVNQGLSDGFTVATVYRAIDDQYRQHSNNLIRENQRRYQVDPKFGREKSRRRRANYGEAIRLYEKHYRRLTRQPEPYLSAVFANRDQADLTTITTEIRSMCDNVNFGNELIRRVISQHIRTRGPPHLVPKSDDSYEVVSASDQEAQYRDRDS